jgi:poly(hydroxyalkanoate) granule-associated protein
VAKKLKLNIGAKKSAPSEDTGASAESLADGNLGKVIKDSAQEIWLAGLGAYSRAQDEGSKVFESLVKAGKEIESRTRSVAGSTAEAMASKAAGTWSKLEQVFEDRVARALNRLGVPRAEEIKELSRRITELNASVQTLLAKQKTAAKRPSAKKLSPSPAIRQTGNVKKPAQPTVRKAAKQQSE